MSTPVLDVIIPYAACNAPGCQQAAATLQLPHLDQLLHRWFLTEHYKGEPTSLTPPHERALAMELGLIEGRADDDGRIPWASWSLQQQAGGGGETLPAPSEIGGLAASLASIPTAWLSPCHWHIGADHVRMADPIELGLDETSSRALLAILAPWFAQDGITLHYYQPTQWLASGSVLAGLATASLDRVVQRDVRPWLPSRKSANAPSDQPPLNNPTQHMLQRLQSEMQMLLYTHPFTEAREAQGLPTVNAFWLHGAGVWGTANSPASAFTSTTNTPPSICDHLRTAALQEDWHSWSQAWARLDADLIARLVKLPPNTRASLTLCGESESQRWQSRPEQPLPWPDKIQRQFKQFLRPYRSSLLISSLCK